VANPSRVIGMVAGKIFLIDILDDTN